MTWYGGPEHMLQDDYGNKRVDIQVEVYSNQAAAQAGTDPLASATSDTGGLWPVEVPADEVWVRIPGLPGKPPTIRQLRGLANAADLTDLAQRVNALEDTPIPAIDGGHL